MYFRPDWLGCIVLTCLLAVTASTLAQERAERQIQRHAAMGQTVKLGGHVNYDRRRPYGRCDIVIPTTIMVVQAPSHGTLAIRDEMVKSADPELGRGDKCRGSSGVGRVVYYTRTSPGSDAFKYDSSSANGVVHVHVTVD